MLFTRLDIQATEMVSTRPLGLVQKLDLQRLGNTSELPKVFDGLEEARLSQDYIHSCWRRSLQLVTPEGQDIATTPKEKFDAIKDGYIGKIQLWETAFGAFLERGTLGLDVDEVQAIRLLQLQQHYNFVYIVIDHQAAAVDETTWDPYTSQFQAIVSLASDILSAGLCSEKPLFSLDTGIIGPLYFVASRCRNPTIRRQAIACLKSTNRQEGVWESQIVGHVAQRVMEIEESAAGINIAGLEHDELIPSWARVRGVQPQLDPGGRMGVVHYIRYGSNSKEPFKNALHEVIKW